MKDLLKMIRHFEGLYLKAYLCPAGIPTIGIGTTVYPSGMQVQKGHTCTEDEAEAFLEHELLQVEKQLKALVKVSLNDNQKHALMSFIYNVGSGNFQKSTMLKLLNDGDYVGASFQFERWNKAAGKVWPGLIRRRAAEKLMFEGKDWRDAITK